MSKGKKIALLLSGFIAIPFVVIFVIVYCYILLAIEIINIK